jgi:hypothetical protein
MKMHILEEVIRLGIPLLIGALIGYFIEKWRVRIKFDMNAFDMYDTISKEIIALLTEITSLNLYRSCEKSDMEKWKCKISDLYFKYFIYLPQDVLIEMNCLHLCLSHKGQYLYQPGKDNKGDVIIERCDDKQKFKKFVDSVTLYNDGRITALVDKYGIGRFPCSFKVNFQARKVIKTIFDYWKYEPFVRKIKKRSLLENRRMGSKFLSKINRK